MKYYVTVAMMGLLFATNPVFAEKGGKGHGHGHAKHEARGDDDHDGNTYVTIRIGGDDRTVIHEYMGEHYGKGCPPGLAKKHNGCLPPGQAKKRYRVGRVLPETVVYEPIPYELEGYLHPAPGYQYVMVDKDVLLISEASHHVIDAVTLLSAVGR